MSHSKFVLFFKESSSLHPDKGRKTESIVMTLQKCKFHDPRDKNSWAWVWPYIVKMQYLFSSCLQIKYIVMVTKEGTIKIVSFMIPGAGVLVLGRGHTSHY